MLGWRRRLQKVHRWRFGRVVFGEGHSETEFLSRVNGAFRTTDGDDPHPGVVAMITMMIMIHTANITTNSERFERSTTNIVV